MKLIHQNQPIDYLSIFSDVDRKKIEDDIKQFLDNYELILHTMVIHNDKIYKDRLFICHGNDEPSYASIMNTGETFLITLSEHINWSLNLYDDIGINFYDERMYYMNLEYIYNLIHNIPNAKSHSKIFKEHKFSKNKLKYLIESDDNYVVDKMINECNLGIFKIKFNRNGIDDEATNEMIVVRHDAATWAKSDNVPNRDIPEDYYEKILKGVENCENEKMNMIKPTES